MVKRNELVFGTWIYLGHGYFKLKEVRISAK